MADTLPGLFLFLSLSISFSSSFWLSHRLIQSMWWPSCFLTWFSTKVTVLLQLDFYLHSMIDFEMKGEEILLFKDQLLKDSIKDKFSWHFFVTSSLSLFIDSLIFLNFYSPLNSMKMWVRHFSKALRLHSNLREIYLSKLVWQTSMGVCFNDCWTRIITELWLSIRLRFGYKVHSIDL